VNAPSAVDVALFRGESAAELLPITMIEPWPHNPRRSIDPAHLVELADSISKVGVLQPILVRPIGAMFSIVSGERRFRAAKRAGLTEIPAVVRTLTDAEALEIAVTENLQREDVPALDEAEGYERLHLSHGYTVEEIADKVGKSKTYVYSRLKLTSLCAEARVFLRDGQLTPTVALLIARIPTPSEQVDAAKYCAADHSGRPLSATMAADYIKRSYMLRLLESSFPLDDATLVPAAGSCSTCPKRTGNQPELFGDVTDTDTCTDATCYAGKERAHMDRQGAAHEAEGGKVLRGDEAKDAITWGRHLKVDEWIDVDATCYADNASRDWHEVLRLAKRPPKITLIEHPDGWIRAVPRKTALKVLAELGMGQKEEEDADDNDTPQARHAANQVADRDWQVAREQALALYRAVVGEWPRPVTLEETREIARELAGAVGGEVARAMRDFGYKLDSEDRDETDNWEYLQGLADTLSVQGLSHLCIAAALAGNLGGNPEALQRLADIAREIGLDPDGILAKVKADIESERADAAQTIAEIEKPKAKKPRKKKAAEPAAEAPAEKVETRVATHAEWPFPTNAKP
jgi:ParB/RepB/Spo0J family partition protein